MLRTDKAFDTLRAASLPRTEAAAVPGNAAGSWAKSCTWFDNSLDTSGHREGLSGPDEQQAGGAYGY